MRRLLVLLVPALAMVLASLGSVPAQAAPWTFRHLDPGGQPRLSETVPVNVVFVGYDRRAVSTGAFRSGLPRRYEPVVRSRLDYGQTEKLGIDYRYDYRIGFAGRRYEDRFFARLRALAKEAPVTASQQAYNNQRGNARTVTSNAEIPAPAVERWLADNPPAGVDTRRNTVFLINWYGRRDFLHHVYVKQNEPDPDTGYNFGRERDNRRMVAWGGTTARDEEDGLGRTRRIWFHDLSAGPEAWAGSWNVDNADLDGDRVPDYRIPVAWEYGRYRAASALPGDLAKLVRYVALDLLFTTSPVYPAELPVPDPARTVNIDSNTYEGWPGVDASATYIKPRLLVDELQEVTPLQRLDYDNQDLPFTGLARTCYDAYLAGQSCFPGQGYPPIANFYLQNRAELTRTQDDAGSVDYELPVFNYAVDGPVPALGFADDNYIDGTQSYVFNFISPGVVQGGYGLTTTMIHEVGHHLGLSHPHDGYDSESGVDFAPTGPYYFANAGDEVNSMMSYIDLNWDFSQFDRDNLHRFQAAALVESANRLAAAALEARNPERARRALRAADVAVGVAQERFARHDYLGALRASATAYGFARAGAAAAGVDLDADDRAQQRRAADARAAAAHTGDPAFVDPADGPRFE